MEALLLFTATYWEERIKDFSEKYMVIRSKSNKCVATHARNLRKSHHTAKWISTRIGCIISILAHSQNSHEHGPEQCSLQGPALSRGLDETTSRGASTWVNWAIQTLSCKDLDPPDRYFILQRFLYKQLCCFLGQPWGFLWLWSFV